MKSNDLIAFSKFISLNIEGYLVPFLLKYRHFS